MSFGRVPLQSVMWFILGLLLTITAEHSDLYIKRYFYFSHFLTISAFVLYLPCASVSHATNIFLLF